MIKIGEGQTFKKMEEYLQEWDNRDKALIVEDRFGDHGMMHVFGGNFCGDWLSGDGVIFWSNKDVTSAEPEDEFKLIEIVKF